jgi:hypothetical protein
VAYGDGVYKSTDGGNLGKIWGLKTSEHISQIIVDPTDPNTILLVLMDRFGAKVANEVFINLQMAVQLGHV